MKAVILAAGLASRLRPLTDSKPKCLLEVDGKTLLGRTIDNVVANGIESLVIVVGYRHEQIREFIGENYPNLKVEYVYNGDYDKTNNIVSLFVTEKYVAGEEFILLDSDILFSAGIIRMVLADGGANVLAMNRHELGEEEIKIISDSERNVLEISKTCSIKDAVGESVGIEKMSAEYSSALFKELHQIIEVEGKGNVFYEYAFERLTKQGHVFKYVDTTEEFSMEIDTVEDYGRVKDMKL